MKRQMQTTEPPYWLTGRTPNGQFVQVPTNRILLIRQVCYRGNGGDCTMSIVVDGLPSEVLMNFWTPEIL